MEVKNFGFKANSTGEEGGFTGYLSVFDVQDSYGDVVRPGAFAKCLGEKDTFPLLNGHDPDQLLGDFRAREDERGLFIEGSMILAVQTAREKYALLKRGSLSGLSIGFETVRDEWDSEGGVRYLHEIRLWEGSLVTFPALDSARVQEVREWDADRIRDLRNRLTGQGSGAPISVEEYLRNYRDHHDAAVEEFMQKNIAGHKEK